MISAGVSYSRGRYRVSASFGRNRKGVFINILPCDPRYASGNELLPRLKWLFSKNDKGIFLFFPSILSLYQLSCRDLNFTCN